MERGLVRFKGRIRFDDVTSADLDCFIEVDETHVHFMSGEESLGSWCLADVVANRVVANIFEIDLDGEVVTFLADDQVNFAYGAVQSMAEGWARFHALNFLRRKGAIAAARRANAPSRLDETRHAFAVAREELEVSASLTDTLADEAAAQEGVIDSTPASEPVGASQTETPETDVPGGGGFWDRVKRATEPTGEETVADTEPVDRTVEPVVERETALEAERTAEPVAEPVPAVEPVAEPEPEPEPVEVSEPELEPEPVAVSEPEPVEVSEPGLEPEPVSVSEDEPEPDGTSLPSAGRLPRLDSLPRKRTALRRSQDVDDHPGPVAKPDQVEPVIPAAVGEPVVLDEPEVTEEPAAIETPLVGEQEAEEPADIEEPAAFTQPGVDEPGALDPVEDAPVAEEPDSTPETDVEVDARPDPDQADDSESKEPSSNGHGAPRREPVAIGAYGDGHHPAETSGLRASMRSLFSRSKAPHEHTFVESTTAVGITRRVCLECGHVSIGVSD